MIKILLAVFKFLSRFTSISFILIQLPVRIEIKAYNIESLRCTFQTSKSRKIYEISFLFPDLFSIFSSGLCSTFKMLELFYWKHSCWNFCNQNANDTYTEIERFIVSIFHSWVHWNVSRLVDKVSKKSFKKTAKCLT